MQRLFWCLWMFWIYTLFMGVFCWFSMIRIPVYQVGPVSWKIPDRLGFHLSVPVQVYNPNFYSLRIRMDVVAYDRNGYASLYYDTTLGPRTHRSLVLPVRVFSAPGRFLWLWKARTLEHVNATVVVDAWVGTWTLALQ
jgi:hypothetical protein